MFSGKKSRNIPRATFIQEFIKYRLRLDKMETKRLIKSNDIVSFLFCCQMPNANTHISHLKPQKASSVVPPSPRSYIVCGISPFCPLMENKFSSTTFFICSELQFEINQWIFSFGGSIRWESARNGMYHRLSVPVQTPLARLFPFVICLSSQWMK